MLVLAIMLLPVVLRVVVELIKRPADLSWRLHLRDVVRSLGRYTAQAVCALAFLPDEAYYSLDAVLRTLTRLIHHETQFAPMAHVYRCGTRRADRLGRQRFGRCGSRRSCLSLLGGYLVRFRADALPASVPLLVLWLTSPAIAWWLSRPLPSRDDSFDPRRHGVS